MNIIYLEHYAGSPTHGMEFRPFFMAQRWAEQGHNVTIAASAYSHLRSKNPDMQGQKTREEFLGGVRFFWIDGPQYSGNGMGRIKNMLSFLRGVYRYEKEICAQGKPDAVIASSTYPLDIYPAHKIAKKYGARLVYEVHDLWPLSPMELGGMSKYHPFIAVMQRAENYCYKHCDAVVSMLPNALEHMKTHGLSPEKFVYVPNGIRKEDWKQQSQPEPDAYHGETLKAFKKQGDFLVAYAGAHGIANALDSFIEAGILLKGKNVKLILVGQGPEKKRLAQKVKDLGLEDTVVLLPSVKREAIPALLARMDALYIGLQRQSLFRFGVSPNKLMDYMMAAKPVIFAIEAGNDLVKEAGCGISIEPENPKEIARAALELSKKSEQELAEMGARGQEYILKHHEYEVLSQNFLQALKG